MPQPHQETQLPDSKNAPAYFTPSSVYCKNYRGVSCEEKELTEQEQSEILQSLFRTYMNQVKDLAEELNINKTTLQKIFQQEIMT